MQCYVNTDHYFFTFKKMTLRINVYINVGERNMKYVFVITQVK